MKLIKRSVIFTFIVFLYGCGNLSDEVDLQATIDAQATQLAAEAVETETLPDPSRGKYAIRPFFHTTRENCYSQKGNSN